ncbi:sensor histidine kinase [Zafaria sp. Z1313]|uniref:sensor histidine kinase n=1 Tax=Zafaria sp. Z1313 TaxID=3423202 RepID=UPI003D301ADE
MNALKDTAPAAAGHPASEPVRGVRATWIYTLVSIVFLVAVANSLTLLALLGADAAGASGDGPVWAAAVLLILSTLTTVRFCWFLRAGLGQGLPGSWPVAALFLPPAALWILGLFHAPLALFAAIPWWLACCCAAALLAPRARYLLLVVGLGLLVVHAPLAGLVAGPAAVRLPEDRSLVMMGVYALFVPLMVIGSVWWWQVVVRLEASRHESSQLAVARERLRFAADLHDIQGHHLQVIALKTELAARLLPTRPDEARQQIEQAQGLARTALEDTRALVYGYRQISFADEVRNAADVLAAAGIRCADWVESRGLGTAEQKLLGLVVREATTNILRHADASRASIALRPEAGGWLLEIANDGVARPAPSDADPPSAAPGTGLSGLARRFEERGGRFEAAADGGSFTVRALLPAGPAGGEEAA